jgi:hypothetical protein
MFISCFSISVQGSWNVISDLLFSCFFLKKQKLNPQSVSLEKLLMLFSLPTAHRYIIGPFVLFSENVWLLLHFWYLRNNLCENIKKKLLIKIRFIFCSGLLNSCLKIDSCSFCVRLALAHFELASCRTWSMTQLSQRTTQSIMYQGKLVHIAHWTSNGINSTYHLHLKSKPLFF